MAHRLVNGNIPTYVGVYNTLYSDIMNQVYLEEQKLPSETALAKKYGVSRNTLRQALAILCEDGLIIKSQGKGTIVAKRKDVILSKKIVNPMTSMCLQPIDEIEIKYNYGPPTDIARAKLGLGKSDIVLASTNIFCTKEKVVGYSFIQIPTDCFVDLDIDSSSEISLKELVEHTIFDAASLLSMDIKLIFANKIEKNILKIEEGKPLLLIESILYNNTHEPFARCKFYFIPEYYNLHFHT